MFAAEIYNRTGSTITVGVDKLLMALGYGIPEWHPNPVPPIGSSSAAGLLIDTAGIRTRDGTLGIDADGKVAYNLVFVDTAYIEDSKAIECKVYRSTTQSISDVTWTNVNFDSEFTDNDPNGEMHSTSTNTHRIEAKTKGTYKVMACIAFDSNATGRREVALKYNDGATKTLARGNCNAVSGTHTFITVSGQLNMDVGDYVYIQVYQSSGGALNLVTVTDNYAPVLAVARIA